MARLSNLAWVAIAGNPICPSPPLGTHHIESIQLGEITRGPYLGEGASGEVFEATWRGQPVAIKMFKADVSPDGRARDEIDVACFVDHPNLTKVIASVETPTVCGCAAHAGIHTRCTRSCCYTFCLAQHVLT